MDFVDVDEVAYLCLFVFIAADAFADPRCSAARGVFVVFVYLKCDAGLFVRGIVGDVPAYVFIPVFTECFEETGYGIYHFLHLCGREATPVRVGSVEAVVN